MVGELSFTRALFDVYLQELVETFKRVASSRNLNLPDRTVNETALAIAQAFKDSAEEDRQSLLRSGAIAQHTDELIAIQKRIDELDSLEELLMKAIADERRGNGS